MRCAPFRSLVLLLAASSGLALLAPSARAFVAPIVVEPTGTDCTGQAALVVTNVQDGVNQALILGEPTVQICPGLYLEKVVVNDGGLDRTLSIEGVGAVQTAVVISAAGQSGPTIDVISAAEVHIRNLTVDGLSAMVGPVRAIGIRYGRIDGSVREVTVRNIRNADGSLVGIGIEAAGPPGPAGGAKSLLEISDCTVANVSQLAIGAVGDGVEIDVQGCTLTGPAAPFALQPIAYGVELPARARIQDTTDQGFVSCPCFGPLSRPTTFCFKDETPFLNQFLFSAPTASFLQTTPLFCRNNATYRWLTPLEATLCGMHLDILCNPPDC